MKLVGAVSGLVLCHLSWLACAVPAVPHLIPSPEVDVEQRPKDFTVLAAAPAGNTIDRSGWKVECDSEEKDHGCSMAIDGNEATFWLTLANTPSMTHNITVDMGTTQVVSGLSMVPRKDNKTEGWVGRHQVLLSTDGKTWSSPVAWGNWVLDSTPKVSAFEPKSVRYVRLVAVSQGSGVAWTSIAELNLFRAYTDPAPENTAMGRWGPTLDFPIVPVAGAVDPESGKVVVWSAFLRDQFAFSPGGYTLTSTWDPATGEITERNVTNISHDMFCPGISMDANGRIVVTGGSDAEKTSFYDPDAEGWVPGPDMMIPRGYQASATCSDGRIFTIGGSWSGGWGNKNGEIYNPSSDSWTLLSGAEVTPMLTNDTEGIYRADNHAWLFGWKDGSVFQAGPSTAMNWYNTSGSGAVTPAGARNSSRGVDPDSMCGSTVMYDAPNGKILALGGSPWYRYNNATSHAHIITIDKPGSPASVSFAANGMHYARVFHSSIPLPDGTIFITGGQSFSYPFQDSTPQLTPELYDPETDVFTDQQPNSIVRVYHSLALLLPDATIFNAGGGLCGDECNANHFDAQIYSPRYLFDGGGNLATRPVIQSVPTQVKAGGTLTITTDSEVKKASLIRYGSATHTINTDQRRIPLALQSFGDNKYNTQLPADLGIMLPGYWMLFVVNAAGVPSIAATVKVLL